MLASLLMLSACNESAKKEIEEKSNAETLPELAIESGVSLMVLGTVQDAGAPHIACKKACCAALFENPDPSRKVVSLGILDHDNQETFLFDATPDISEQVKLLKRNTSWEANELPTGIFLTHAHIGHYTGLMFLGKEATNAPGVPTYIMPKMKTYLEGNGPWSQLVSEKNIILKPIKNREEVPLSANLKVVPLQVPHRDEFSETVGYTIIGPDKSALFIPDIDKWEKWEHSIVDLIRSVDYAFLDASFYDGNELNTRDISQIPHPFVIESMGLFGGLPESEKKKIHFIHLNHTNPLLDPNSDQFKEVLAKGFNVAKMGMKVQL